MKLHRGHQLLVWQREFGVVGNGEYSEIHRIPYTEIETDFYQPAGLAAIADGCFFLPGS